MSLLRREFLKTATIAAVTSSVYSANNCVARERNVGGKALISEAVQNAVTLGDRLVEWQSSYGSTDLSKCPYRSPMGTATITIVQGIGPQVRALYQLYKTTGDAQYKTTADRYAVFVISTLHDPPVPLINTVTIDGKSINTNSSAWVYGKSLSPCYEWFVANNPQEDLLNLKAHSIYRWLQRHRRDDSYFGVGYPTGNYKDAQFSCDLGEVGTGLVGFYKTTKHEPALTDAKGLAKYFLTEHEDGSASGVWSSKIGTWLVGPWPGSGAEHFTGQEFDKVGWGWSCLVVGEFLLELHKLINDKVIQELIGDRCVRAFRWCLDKCQFDDGAHGMFGRDDKWVGQTAAAILLYAKLVDAKLLPASVEASYRSKIEKSWQWMLGHTGSDSYPTDGYIKVTGSTTTKPPENLLWMMAWTIEALLAGDRLFAPAK